MGSPGPDTVFRESLKEGRFTIQKCSDCGTHIYHPRVLCTNCGSDQLEFVEPSGSGTVYSVTVVRRRLERGGPYNVCLVDLDEGPRIMSRVEDIPHDDVKIGMKVTAFVGDMDDTPQVLFRAIEEPSS